MFCFYSMLLQKWIFKFINFIFKGCGGILNGEDDGVIMLLNYFNFYDMMSNCSWLIRVDYLGMLFKIFVNFVILFVFLFFLY